MYLEKVFPKVSKLEYNKVLEFNSIIDQASNVVNIAHMLNIKNASFLVFAIREIHDYLNLKTINGKPFIKLREFLLEKNAIKNKISVINNEFFNKFSNSD